jgi:L-alanine-DL-glutamate epimerase-like enolase superfamily enzyme
VRITAIRVQRLRLPLDPPFYAAWDPDPRRTFDATLVRVETDEGLTGIASGDTMSGFEEFEALFIGRDPLTIARHARTLETISFHAGRYWPLEAALWDLLGKATGQPVATLLGGSRDRVPAYASLGELRLPAQRAQDAQALVAQGFRAVKVRIARDRLAEGIAVVAAIRNLVGDGLAIMVDLGVLWVEEPLAAADLSGMAAVRGAAPGAVRIAGGEMAQTFEELFGALERDALDVFQPDVVLSLGICGARTLADVALRRNRWFTPHTWTNGIGVLANLHVCCGVGGGPWLEFPYDPPGWVPERRDFMLAEPLWIDRDGCVAVPDAPGLGIALDEEAVSHYAL